MDVVNAEKAPMEKKSREKVNRRNRKREKYVPSSEPLELPFCRICGKRASGIHFGVYSCEACKVTFRLSECFFFRLNIKLHVSNVKNTYMHF